MYKRLLLILVLLLISVTISQAQDAAWPVVQSCMGDLTYPIVPRSQWDFPGVIVTSAYPEGVRGIRGDLDVEYFVALEAEDSFPLAGAVSSDGQYFAYPIGDTSNHVNSVGENIYGVEQVAVVRVDGDTREKHLFEAFTQNYGLGIGSQHLPPLKWLGADWVYYNNMGPELVLTNFKTAETKPWTLASGPSNLTFISPDGTRGFYGSLYDLEADKSLSYSAPQSAAWFADSLAFVAANRFSIEIVNRDGAVLATPWQGTAPDVAAAPNGKAFAFRDENQNLYVADMEAQVIYDLCFTGKAASDRDSAIPIVADLAWSPDSSALAFTYDGYVVILNTQNLTNQILDHRAVQVMGWYPLADEVIEPVTGIRPPQPTATPIPTTARPTAVPTATATPAVAGCELEVITGANLRAGAGTDTEKVGSAAVGSGLQADGQQLNESDHFRWWRLTTGEWIREDFVKEDANCEFLPEVAKP